MQNVKKWMKKNDECEVFSLKLLLDFIIWIRVNFVLEILIDDRFGFVRNTTFTNSSNFIT